MFQGSQCQPEFVPSANKFIKNARQRILDAKIIEMQNLNSLESCDAIDDLNLRNNCKSKIAIEKSLSNNDNSWCDNLDPSLRDACKDEFFVNLAVSKKDKKICDNVKNDDTKNNCKNIVDVILWE